MRSITIALLILTVGLSSCTKDKIEGKIKFNPELAGILRFSPVNVTIENKTYFLETYLYRDFMPVAEENGSPMICINYLIDNDSLSIPRSIVLKKQYVIKGNEIWTADYSETRRDMSFILEGVVRGGPKWGPNIDVDVVCEFEVSGIIYRVLAKSQKIDSTS